MPLPTKKPSLVAAKKAAAPVGKRQASRDVDEDEAPRKAGGSLFKRSGAAKVSGAKKASRSDDDGGRQQYSDTITTGWGGAENMRDSMSTFAKTIKLKDGETVVIRFLDDAPYASIKQHWLKRNGRVSFICPGRGCPLCAIGETVRGTYCFNIAKLTDGDPIHYSLDVGVKVYEQIKSWATHERHKPLSRKWYTYTRTGSGKNNTSYTLRPIRQADIEEEDASLYVPSEEELATIERYTVEKTINPQRSSISALQEIAAEMTGGENYDEGDPEDEDER